MAVIRNIAIALVLANVTLLPVFVATVYRKFTHETVPVKHLQQSVQDLLPSIQASYDREDFKEPLHIANDGSQAKPVLFTSLTFDKTLTGGELPTRLRTTDLDDPSFLLQYIRVEDGNIVISKSGNYYLSINVLGLVAQSNLS